MWTRRELKERAKVNFKASYWKSVLVGVIFLLCGGITQNFNTNLNAGQTGLDAQTQLSGAQIQLSGVGGGLPGLLIGAGVSVIVVALLVILLNIFVLEPIRVGCRKYYLETAYEDSDLKYLGYSFQTNYLNIVKVEFSMMLEVLLWTLLLIIPGIIKAYSYRMVPYILAEYPDITAKEAKQLSAEMMDGQKWKSFVLDISFLPWFLLSALTLNIVGVFWVNPYVVLTEAELYKVLADNIQEQE